MSFIKSNESVLCLSDNTNNNESTTDDQDTMSTETGKSELN